MESTLAFGLDLRLTADGRSAPIGDDDHLPAVDGIHLARRYRYGYRASWSLPQMHAGEQTSGYVVGLGAPRVVPGGEPVRAVILVPYPATVEVWEQTVPDGSLLPMYEGDLKVGEGRVRWRRTVTVLPDDDDLVHFVRWLTGQTDGND